MKFSHTFLMVFFLISSVYSFAYDWADNPGDGSAENPFQISEPEQLMSIGSDANLLTKNYILTADIVFDPNNNPAHTFTDSLIAADPYDDFIFFTGHFDGGGYKIINLKITSPERNTGLFGKIKGSSAGQVVVENLTFVNPILEGRQRVGPLVGLAEECTIQNCHTIGGSVGHEDSLVAGGLTGGGFYTILKECSSSADVSGNVWVGGLSGSNNSSTFIKCSASGDVAGNQFVGGLVGDFKQWHMPELNEREEVVDCFATGDVHAGNGKGGGLIGLVSSGLVKNCYATGTVTGGSELGGLIGVLNKPQNNSGVPVKVTKSYATGNVTGQGNSVGGLVGGNGNMSIGDCYATGDVTGNSYVGGLVGIHSGTAAFCYSTGRVEGVEHQGGLIGYASYGTVHLSYWDSQASGISESARGTAKTTAQMKSLTTYKGWGDDVWVLDQGNDYPHLAWESASGEPIVDIRNYSGGSGKANDPYRIATPENLISLGICRADWDKHFILVDDIVLDPAAVSGPNLLHENANYNKIGFYKFPFKGHFNGNFHSISNLRINNFDICVALFGAIEGTAPDDIVVENLMIIDPEFSSVNRTGALAGIMENAKVSRCGVTGFNLTSTLDLADAGGLIGYANNAHISMSFAEVRFDRGNNVSSGGPVGGLIGHLFVGKIDNSYAVATFNSPTSYCGGLVGRVWDGDIRYCYTVPAISVQVSTAGLVAINDSQPFACYYRKDYGISDSYAYGLSDSQMKTSSTFAVWDFLGESIRGSNEIWRMCVDGVDYPRLSWQFAKDGDFACGDGVDILDLQALAENWLTAETDSPETFNYSCDANGDEKIDLEDLKVLSEN